MKVYEMSFRDMDQKMVEIHGMKMVKLLEKMGLKLDNLYGALMYGYIDHNAGFIFEIVALETKKRNIEYRIVPIGVSCKIPRFDVQEMDIQIFKSHLFTFQNQTANLVPDSVPHLKYLPHAAFGTFVVIKTHQPLFQFYRFHHITHRRITAPGNIPPRLENLSYTTGKVPSFSQPGEFSLPDFIGRIGVNTGG